MSEVKQIEGCRFIRAWIGECREHVVDRGMCEKHAPAKCCSCGKPATRECDHTGIQFVCGRHICDDCMHSAPAEGETNWFLLGGGHKPKAEAEALWDAYYKRERIRYAEAERDAAQKKLDAALAEARGATP